MKYYGFSLNLHNTVDGQAIPDLFIASEVCHVLSWRYIPPRSEVMTISYCEIKRTQSENPYLIWFMVF